MTEEMKPPSESPTAKKPRSILPVLVGGIGILLCAAGVAPIRTPGFYIAGIILSVTALVLAFRMKSSVVLPIGGLLLNSVALYSWPNAIGFFPLENGPGYEFRVDNRLHQLPIEMQGRPVVLRFAGRKPAIGDVVSIYVDGAKKPVQFPYAEPSGFATVPIGPHQIDVFIGDKKVFSGEADVKPLSPPAGVLTEIQVPDFQ
jgi:hypothetical protein